MKQFYIFAICIFFFSTVFSTAQIFDEELPEDYYLRNITNNYLNEAYELFTQIHNPELTKLAAPVSALVDLRQFELDQEANGNLNIALERFAYIYATNKDAIEVIEKIFEIDRISNSFKLAGAISAAIFSYNDNDYLRTIKYINWWHSYREIKRHQFYYILSSSYMNIGDHINAYKNFVVAEKLYETYVNSGPNMRDTMGIDNYDQIVEELQNSFGHINNIQEVKNDQIKVEIPAQDDTFWMIKPVPRFPRNALGKGRTGYVVAQYDLNKYGRPINVEYIDYSNSLFKRAADNFIRQVKYIQYQAPDGDENIAEGLTYRIDFKYKG